MDHFLYRDGVLHAEDISVTELAERFGTPFFCYSRATLERHYTVFAEAVRQADPQAGVYYSVKSNSNQAVIACLAALGAGADCVSGGEIRRARAAGIPGEKMIYAGVGKTEAEIALGLAENISQFNVESLPELRRISAVAEAKNTQAPVALRINPDVDAGTHEKITTGRKQDKFGIAFEQARAAYEEARNLPGIRVRGLAVHIGSQIASAEPFRKAFAKTVSLAETLRSEGHSITHLDLGGGLAAPYEGAKDGAQMLTPQAYGAVVKDTAGGKGFTLAFEPGRVISANAGILVTRVIYVKESEGRLFYITDAAMNDLIRPSFYDAYHAIVPAEEQAERGTETADIVGPVCETGDVFAKQRAIQQTHEGEYLAIRSAGAYGAVMGSNYNTRALPPEIMVSGSEAALIRKRQNIADIIAADNVPLFLGPPQQAPHTG